MPTFELTLSAFKFPKDLDNNKANFRLIAELRYVAGDGTLATTQAILPGLDTYWECDRNRQKESNYVRGKDEGSWGTIDIGRVDAWDRLIFLLPASKLHSLQFKIFDVNRTDGWDKIRNALSSITEAIFEEAKKLLPGMFGSAPDDVKSFLLKKWAGGDDLLFKGSFMFGDEITGIFKIAGAYEIHFHVDEHKI
ncbi:hypothetical protein L0222_13550 [bacterium]|nr:hypothetical protein [bacterium]MCI0606372.1 hypothetical protein [bacterium]